MTNRRPKTAIRHGDDGSTIPLIVGFFLVALLFVGAAVMASDAFTRQRDLQSICDGAATAAANSVDFASVRGELESAPNLPLGDLQAAIDAYLSDEPSRSGVVASAGAPDGLEVTVGCSRHSVLAFAGMLGSRTGIEQHTTSTARAPVQ
ncbi:MAG: uncharacterized protein JWM76_3111 [Pseudonocardiales bacterium]|nr:uncharacterized protein [Pseudonocardiales bacterium]